MTFYRYYKNKEDVAKIVLKNIIDESNKKFESIMESDNLFINKIENLILLNESLIDRMGSDFLNDIISLKANIFKSLIDKQSIYEEKKIEEYFDFLKDEKQKNPSNFPLDFELDDYIEGYDKKMIEETGDDKYSSEWNRMRNIHQNDTERREYMFRQTMAQSLIREAEIS